MVIVIGECLFDIFPDYQRIGGAPFNFAYHLKKMGAPVRFVTRVGEDRYGRQIIEMLKRNGFDDADIEVDSRYPTGTVHVALDAQGVPDFSIRENVAYDYLQLDALAGSDQKEIEMIYVGTLVQRTDHNYHQIRQFLSSKPSHALGFCDLNLRPPHVNCRAVETCLRYSDLLKLNDSELAFLREHYQGPVGQDDYVKWLMTRFCIKAVALTVGFQGSTLYLPNQVLHSRPPVRCAVKDTVGAGDGFSAALAFCWTRGLAPRSTIELANGFAAKICSIQGAVPDGDQIYDFFEEQIAGGADA